MADVTVLCVAFIVAYLPAVNIQLGDFYFDLALIQLPFVVFIQFSSLFLFGAYSILWRYISIEDIKVFVKAGVVSCAALVFIRFVLDYSDFYLWQIPISVVLIDSLLAFSGLLAVRVLRRFIYEFGEKSVHQVRGKARKQKPALLIGAGRVGATLIKAMAGRADAELEIRGLIDDDPRKKGSRVGGLKVLGSTKELRTFVNDLKIEQVVIAVDDARGKEIRRILDVCRQVPVKARIVPSLNEIAHGRVSISRLRDVEIEDLLGRDPVVLDNKNLHDFISDKTIMVTGAGGSIGSELVRQIASYSPKVILLIERAEYLLFNISREMAADPDGNTIALIGDVCDEPRMRSIIEQYSPDVIFHAAAHKHVSIMEANTAEAIKNNVFGTHTIGKLAGELGVRDFVLISTDKAVNPTSVMGASKRLAEIVVQSLNTVYPTNYMAVRFGNVLGSAGSVVPIFREQIQKGEAITVTDPEMTRYFMTIPEASQLVLQAGALGSGGEIFILDMGKPVKILELAEDMIRLSGLTAYEDIDIVFTGARKGEKLFEELEITGEDLEKTLNPKIFIGKIAEFSVGEVNVLLDELRKAVKDCDDARIRELINEKLPEANVVVDQPAAAPEPKSTGTEKNDKFFAQPGTVGLSHE